MVLYTRVPAHQTLEPYVIRALLMLGGEASGNDIDEFICKDIHIYHTDKKKLTKEATWSRTDLHNFGLLENPHKGTWRIANRLFSKFKTVDEDSIDDIARVIDEFKG